MQVYPYGVRNELSGVLLLYISIPYTERLVSSPHSSCLTLTNVPKSNILALLLLDIRHLGMNISTNIKNGGTTDHVAHDVDYDGEGPDRDGRLRP